jgi:hypothetical protein
MTEERPFSYYHGHDCIIPYTQVAGVSIGRFDRSVTVYLLGGHEIKLGSGDEAAAFRSGLTWFLKCLEDDWDASHD